MMLVPDECIRINRESCFHRIFADVQVSLFPFFKIEIFYHHLWYTEINLCKFSSYFARICSRCQPHTLQNQQASNTSQYEVS